MKKRIVEILTVMLTATMLAGCSSTGSEATLTTDNGILEGQQEYNAAQDTTTESENTLSLSNKLKGAVCAALISQFNSDYSEEGYVIPEFHILAADDGSPDDIKVWGDFWLYAYRLEDDTLISVIGESVTGCMHLQVRNGVYQCTDIDVAEVGRTKEKTEQDIFGDSYQSLLDWRQDYEEQEKNRAQLIADYAAAFGIAAVNYSDQGWRSAKLPDPSPDEDNVFLYMQQKEETTPEPETPEEESVAPETSYVVVRGDVLERIAKRYGFTTVEFAKMNQDTIFRYAHAYGVKSNILMKCADYIYPGEVLTLIPESQEETEAAGTADTAENPE